jgi:hypothetical protein
MWPWVTAALTAPVGSARLQSAGGSSAANARLPGFVLYRIWTLPNFASTPRMWRSAAPDQQPVNEASGITGKAIF